MENLLSSNEIIFMTYNYTEIKDLMTKFLTLTSGTLVISIAFSEKITKTHEADRLVRMLMFSAWSLLFMALIFGGGSVIYIAAAGGCVVYKSVPFFDCNVNRLNLGSVSLGMLAGLSFGIALLCMAISAGRSILLSK
ncbi:MAG: hypothetical protein ACU0DD_13790 [Paracoccus sp. (in: a-proteobacteria)]|uniref:CASP-like protein n=1 Tax=Paracoccus spongiarum TaxID=3064387 RepID=A0ABT9JI09_9RHOB|nr:hypothetical protein [Paracoccus sp. 2205BS29-5]MDP5308671.1 hypothetical protein [Paracoccus sp. 2205BS29-5]